MKCYYNNSDLDGICSAAVIYNEFPDVELIGVGYSDTIDIPNEEKVYVVDFSFPDKVMIELNQKNELIWIDHHATAIEKFKRYKIKGIQRVGIGSCSLVAEYLILPDLYAIRLLAEYDVWDLKDRNCIPFQYGMRALKLNPKSYIFSQLLMGGEKTDELIKEIIKTGKMIMSYVKSY